MNFSLKSLIYLHGRSQWEICQELNWPEAKLSRFVTGRRIFPGDDMGARKRLQAWLELTEPLDYQEVGRLLARWQPFGSLIYFHLLLSNLVERGELAP